MSQPILDDLMSLYENARAAGTELTPEELCRNFPEYTEQIRKRTRALRQISPPNDDTPLRPTTSAAATNAETHSTYSRLQEHARGGLGEVLRARDEQLGRDVALKIMSGHGANAAERKQRFAREAGITSRLEHPGVVPVYGMGVDDNGRPCYAMRFVGGDTLAAAIEKFHAAKGSLQRSNPEFRQLLGRLIQIANTIAYAHSQKIVHRDLKPANILIGSFGETLVVDWGLAKTIETYQQTTVDEPSASTAMDETREGSVVGTPAYMSPEQATGGEISPVTDIFALGGLLYAILTGVAPFNGVATGDLPRRLAAADMPRPTTRRADVPRALEAICVKAMARLPHDRYADAQAFAADVDRWLADGPVSVCRDPWVDRSRRWLQQHRATVTTVAAGLLVAFVGMGIATVVLSNKNQQLAAAVTRAETGEKSAHDHFALARDAVDRFASRVGEDPRLRQKDAELLRRDLLSMAVEFNRRLAEREGNDTALAVEVARAHLRLGNLAFQLGDPTAEKQVRAALEQLQALPASAQSDAERLTDLATAWSGIGMALFERGQVPQSIEPLVTCRTYRTQLLELDANNIEYRTGLATVEQILGQSYFFANKPNEGMPAITHSIELCQQNYAAQPELINGWMNLPRALNILATHYHMTGKRDEAERTWKQAQALVPAKLTDDLDGQGLRLRLVEVNRNLGNHYRELGKLAPAIECYQKSVDMVAGLVQAHPAMARYRTMQAAALFGIGAIQFEQGDDKSAETYVLQAMPIYQRLYDDMPMSADNRQGIMGAEIWLAKIALKRNRPAEAAAWLRKSVAKLTPPPADIMGRQYLSTEWLAVAAADKALAAEGFDHALNMAVGLAAFGLTRNDAVTVLHALADAGGLKEQARCRRLSGPEFAALENNQKFVALKKKCAELDQPPKP